MPSSDRSLGAIAEENTKDIDAEGEIIEDIEEVVDNSRQADEAYDVLGSKQKLSEDELALLSKRFIFINQPLFKISNEDELAFLCKCFINPFAL